MVSGNNEKGGLMKKSYICWLLLVLFTLLFFWHVDRRRHLYDDLVQLAQQAEELSNPWSKTNLQSYLMAMIDGVAWSVGARPAEYTFPDPGGIGAREEAFREAVVQTVSEYNTSAFWRNVGFYGAFISIVMGAIFRRREKQQASKTIQLRA
jgi:hypothetical protein